MSRKENIQLLSKLNILKGHLIEDNPDTERTLKVVNSLFEKDFIKDVIQYIKEENFTAALNFVNSKILDTSNSVFSKPCSKPWDELVSVSGDEIKFCTDCKKNVYFVSNEEDFIKRRNLQQCVALDIYGFEPQEESKRNFKSCRIEFEDDFEIGMPF